MAECKGSTPRSVCPPFEPTDKTRTEDYVAAQEALALAGATGTVGERPWDITEQPRTEDYLDALNQEGLAIAGAKVNVYKLLGVHEQTLLVDLTSNGTAISGGSAQNHPASYAFDIFNTEWRSIQTDPDAVLASAYIGYDFGIQRLPNGRQKYGIDASVRQHITAIKIKQSSNPQRRVTKARVERSENGTEWYGVAVITLPDNDQLNIITFKHSVPNRYWRLRPLQFGGAFCDSWGVSALEMYDYSETRIDNIQDKILMENRDRAYLTYAIRLKGYYDLVNVSTDLSRFGIEIPSSTYQIRVNFSSCVALLGRPIVIGDIIELPSETQYMPDLTPVKRWLEVTDVTWDASTYTPGWRPLMLLVTVHPAMATQETQDIFGDLGNCTDTSGLFRTDDGNSTVYQDFSDIAQTIDQDSKTLVPERGSEGSNIIRSFEESEVAEGVAQGIPNLNKIGFNNTGLYVEDAIPQNGAPYTEGPDFPPTPKNGDYHRLTYEGLAKDVPARLYRYSTTKGRWIFLESDKRTKYNNQKAVLDEYVSSSTKTFASEIK